MPVPLVAPVNVIQGALLVADHVHPAPTVTPTLPVAVPAPTDRFVGEIAGVHTNDHENVFDSVLFVVPPGPTAATRAS